LRRSLLAAVSHDLRTPLAGIKAAVSTLHAPGIVLSQADRGALLEAIEESTDRLASIIDNLLDMSRLQAGAVSLDTQQVGLDDVVWRAVAGVAAPASVEIELPEDLPDVVVDVGLLDRAIANLVQNAVRHTRARTKVDISARAVGERVELRITDHGTGVPDPLKAQLFQPFQRLGDTHSTEGVGLGLAVAKGLTEAQGGTLRPEDTPGGGLTMVMDLPCVMPARPH
jgi:two-component system sensor histidine kinase KdpD